MSRATRLFHYRPIGDSDRVNEWIQNASEELVRLDAVNRELLEALQAIADSVLGGGEIKRKPDSDGYYSEPIHQDEMARVLATIAKAEDV